MQLWRALLTGVTCLVNALTMQCIDTSHQDDFNLASPQPVHGKFYSEARHACGTQGWVLFNIPPNTTTSAKTQDSASHPLCHEVTGESKNANILCCTR